VKLRKALLQLIKGSYHPHLYCSKLAEYDHFVIIFTAVGKKV